MIMALALMVLFFSGLMILLVLLHRGKGGGLSSMFGGGVTTNLSGSSVAEKNLDRFTVAAGIVWFGALMGLGLLLRAAGS